jgi:uncharacterized protein YbaP (TraB family)
MNNLTQSLLEYKGCFWKIENSEGHEGFLLGSLHLGCEALVETNPNIMECFNKAKTLAVECNPEGEIANKFNELKAKEISELISQLDINTIFLEAMNYPEDLTEDKKLIIDGILKINKITSQYSKEAWYGGMEHMFIPMAKERSLEIYDLEKIDTIVNKHSEKVIDGIRSAYESIKDLVNIDSEKLKQVLPEILKKKQQEALQEHLMRKNKVQQVFENWKAGNLNFFERLNQKEDLDPESIPNAKTLAIWKNERMDRNFEMQETLTRLIREDKRPFAIIGTRHTVGAGFSHLPGSFSVIKYLESAGLKITRM